MLYFQGGLVGGGALREAAVRRGALPLREADRGRGEDSEAGVHGPRSQDPAHDRQGEGQVSSKHPTTKSKQIGKSKQTNQVQGQAAEGVPPLPGVGGERPQDCGAAEQGKQRDQDHVQD